MKYLLIAEKPDMARKIGAQINGKIVKNNGYITIESASDTWFISWAFGHLLQSYTPEEYDEKYKDFPGNFKDLPIIPNKWENRPAEGKSIQLKIIKNLINECDQVVHAGDPGREGQLIIDEILYYFKNKKPVLRIILNALDKGSVQKALASLVDNNKYKNLYDAALARQEADWLVGMNLSRAYSILGREQHNYWKALSVGRVQTPTLAIVVKREEEIEKFKTVNYFNIKVFFEKLETKNKTLNENLIESLWYPRIKGVPEIFNKNSQEIYENSQEKEKNENDDEDGTEQANINKNENKKILKNISLPKYLDEEFRIIDRNFPLELKSKLEKNPLGEVLKFSKNTIIETPPLPLELSELQSIINKKLNITTKKVLEEAQILYEAGFITYPRTDSGYLPESQHSDSEKIITNIMKNIELIVKNDKLIPDFKLKSRCFNDDKVGEHHAIIPTVSTPNLKELNENQKEIYKTIFKYYFVQFFENAKIEKIIALIESNNEWFIARGQKTIKAGFRDVLNIKSEDREIDEIKEKEKLKYNNIKITEEKTKSPNRYTEGTLLKAMKNVANLIEDEEERKILRKAEVQGIGRSATRAAIIEILIKRNYLENEKKYLIPTSIAKSLVKAVPKDLVDPGLTARWEHVLDGIAVGKISFNVFMQKQANWVNGLILQAKTVKIEKFDFLQNQQKYKTNSNGSKNGEARDVKKDLKNNKIKNSNSKNSNGEICTVCKKGEMVEKNINNGKNKGKKFLGCSNYPECKNAIWPKN